MRIIEVTKVSFSAVNRNKVRSFLTMLGVIIGVSSVILLVSIGNGIKAYVSKQFEELGTNVVIVLPGKIKVAVGGGPPNLQDSKLSEKEIRNINRENKYVVAASIEAVGNKNVSYRNKEKFAGIYATDEKFPTASNYKLEDGRFFTKAEVAAAAKVAVVGHTIINDVFNGTNPVGKEFKIDKTVFKVIGTYQKRGGVGGTDFDSYIMIPYTTAKLKLDIKTITSFNVRANPNEDINVAKKQIEKALLKTLNKDEFTLLTQEELLSSITSILSTITSALAGIAAISLLVGGIGIMNIMLVSVTERTGEIGLRKAVGATPANLLVQFLIESTMISFLGGVNGIILGYLGSLALRRFVQTSLTVDSVIIAFAFSGLVGIIFGTYPAYKAARKDPIEALRYE